MKKYLLIISLYYTNSTVQQIIDKSNIYVGIGTTYSIGKRNNKKSIFTSVHLYLRKNDFINNISKLQYSTNEIKDNFIKKSPKNLFISKNEGDVLWEYFSNIFDKVCVDENSFFIQYLLNTDFLDKFNMKSKIQDEKNSFMETLININFISHIFNINTYKEISKDFIEIFYLYGFTNFSQMKNGLMKSNNSMVDNTQNEYWYKLSKNKIEKEKITSLNNASKKINNENINFFQQLIPSSDGSLHYFITDKNGQIFHWKSHEDFQYENGTFQKVENFNVKNTNISIDEKLKKQEQQKISEDLKKEKETLAELKKNNKNPEEINKIKQQENQLIEKEKKNEKYEFDSTVKGKDLQLSENIFKKDRKNSNNLTIMYLLEFPNNNQDFPKKIIEKIDLETFIRDLKENTSLKVMEKASLNKIFYFLLGHHGKNISCKKGLLPLSYIKYAGVEDLSVNLKEDGNLTKENLYDISDYENSENNEEIINNAFNSLPITNNMTSESFAAHISICGIYENFIVVISVNRILKYSFKSNTEEKYSPFIVNFYGGYNIFNNIYLTCVGEFLLPNLYKYNKYCDIAVGLGLIMNFKNISSRIIFLIKIMFLFDIYNNILNLKLSLDALVKVWGEDTYTDNMEKPFISYV
jgi:hypothetical protein